MHIVFDMAYDQKIAPSGVQAGQSSIGKLFVGLNGLLNVLEAHLGITGRDVHHADRIQAYLKCMERLKASNEAQFYLPSFEADQWSSAKQLLAWRDELVLAGWSGESSEQFTPRLNALSKIEQALPVEVKRGQGDRFQRVLDVLLNTSPLIAIQKVEVVGDAKKLPSLITTTLFALHACGSNVTGVESQEVCASGNLGMIQQAMRQQTRPKNSVVSNDDSLTLLQAEDEWAAANVVASWLKADESNNGNVALIQGQGSDVLDAALENAGLPVVGNNQRSAWRAALQVLPLALANVWAPLDIHALLSFLSLPRSPVPAFAARRLREAIQNEPGIGGERWVKAENKIMEQHAKKLVEDGVELEQAQKDAQVFMDSLNHYLTSFRFNPNEGIPPKALEELCLWVKKGLKSPELKDSMAQAIAQVDKMVDLAQAYGKPIPRAQVERILDSVIAEGGQNPMARSEASTWHKVADSGGIAAPVETVIWWNFVDPGQSAQTFWSAQEREQLEQLGVHLEQSHAVRARESMQWKNAIMNAGKRLILVSPKRLQGATVQIHPLWDEIRHFSAGAKSSDSEKENAPENLVIDASVFEAQQSYTFAGLHVEWDSEENSQLPQLESVIQVSQGKVNKPRSLSFSQMSKLMSCPASWALSYHAGLYAMDSLSLPTGNQMIGSLCHKIVEDLYCAPDAWSDDDATKQAEQVQKHTIKLFDERVPQMAAELLEPGRELERYRYRENVCEAVLNLIAAIDTAGLHVIKTEGKVEGKDLDGIPFKGYIDLLLEDDSGSTFVIDLKWSGSAKRKKEEVEKGKALQLASYAWMLRSDDGVWAPGAYFMLAQGEMITDNPAFKTSSVIDSPVSNQEIWNQGSKTWSSLFKNMESGEVEIAGLIEDDELEETRSEQGLMFTKPACFFCDFGKLCGKTRAEA